MVFKKPTMQPIVLANYQSILNLQFLGQVAERVVAEQPQVLFFKIIFSIKNLTCYNQNKTHEIKSNLRKCKVLWGTQGKRRFQR